MPRLHVFIAMSSQPPAAGALAFSRHPKPCFAPQAAAHMKFQQLRFLVAVRDSDLSVTAAARLLNTSQPAVSRQIQLLEKELGFQLFERQGRAFTRITSAGDQIIARADSVIREVQNIRRASIDYAAADEGSLTIATTHTQARYVLPAIVRAFRSEYPKVRIHIHQGSSGQIADMMEKGQADLAVATGSSGALDRLVRLPLYRWHLGVVVPQRHALTKKQPLTLKDVAKYPIITYEFNLGAGASILAPFEQEGLEPEVALTAQDVDVVKTYVRIGLGVGLIAPFTVESKDDSDLRVLDASHLFPSNVSWVGFRPDVYQNAYLQKFVEKLAPHLPAQSIRQAPDRAIAFDDDAVPSRGVLNPH
jgi:LysR family transcriptional regulator, cys regulon transcriptional activator